MMFHRLIKTVEGREETVGEGHIKTLQKMKRDLEQVCCRIGEERPTYRIERLFQFPVHPGRRRV